MCATSGNSTSGAPTGCPTSEPNSPGVGLSTLFGYHDSAHPFDPTHSDDSQNRFTYGCENGASISGAPVGSPTCTPGTSTGPSGSLNFQQDQLTTQNQQSFTYNSNGTVANSTDADGNVTTYGYDTGNKNLTKITPPASSQLGPVTITNDADSRPHIITECVVGTALPCTTTKTATLTYDALDRVTQIAYTGPGTTITITYTYDDDGNLATRIDPIGTTTYTVDQLNRLTNEAQPSSVNNAYTYDAASNMTCFTDSGGSTQYQYNGLDQMATMYEAGATCTATTGPETQFTYDNDGRITTETFASGDTVNYTIDPPTGRITAITAKTSSGTTLLSHTLTYKLGKNDTALIQSDAYHYPAGSVSDTTGYSYDALNRLLTASTSGTPDNNSYAYTLDGDGNRTQQQVSMTLSSGGTVHYYQYTPGNLLTCRQTASGACSSGSELSTYSYDTDGNETAITGVGDPATTAFSYNNANQLSGLTPPGGSATSLTYLGPGQDALNGLGTTNLRNSLLGLTKQVDGTGTSYYARSPDGMIVDQRTPSGNYNPIFDAQGSVIGLLDSTGALKRVIRYGPYGENAQDTGPAGYASVPLPFGFQSGYRLAGGNTGLGTIGNGLYHFGQRYYDPTTGRWTQPDPIDQIADLRQADVYSFAGDDPTNDSDPAGTDLLGDVGDVVSSAAEGAGAGAVTGAVVGCATGPEGCVAGAVAGASAGAVTGAESGAEESIATHVAGRTAGQLVRGYNQGHEAADDAVDLCARYCR
jgi:RHS repeat-associated protein